ncbi:MFS transporter [Corynebacterium heidelbergense]|uniref:MFS transporter n=1 Tax=Corynebacterium heidelbergense TaxID=2055947 RepID=A0A364VEC9_9CORY|nr:MFS transporter [Corynebacterium heidelbergense]RAV35005.1 MFS transporter [Corynebacterium heidelbergense]WCZ37451.1 multidrug efflux system protein MdtL [Corynebacterium heidelbergense]
MIEQPTPSRQPGNQGQHGQPSRPGPPSSFARSYPGIGRAWLLVAFAVFMVAWGGNEFTPMMVMYRKESVFSPVFVDSLLASYAIGIAGSLVIAGPLSDRFGRRIVMLPAPIVAIVASVLIAFGETTEWLMFTGRVLSGVSIGIAMTAGGSWIKELSTPAMDRTAKADSGAKRATMSLTGGFAIGALTAGLLAQWAPLPAQLPYVVHVALSVASLIGLLQVPETRQSAHLRVKGSFWSDLFVPTAKHPRFLLAVIPVAPWVFGCAGVAYAIMPALSQDRVSAAIAFSAAVTALCLGCGFGIQQFVQYLTSPRSAKGQIIALCLVIVGMSLAAWVAASRSIPGVLVVAVLLGGGYGLCMISGLSEVQRIAGPDDLGGLTAIFYVVTYIGFLFPMILTKLSQWFTYPIMLGFGVVMATLALVVVVLNSRRHLPSAA